MTMNIRKCHICKQYFGTVAGYIEHRGERGCKPAKSLSREGMWQGHMGVWWTTDLGWDDTTEDWLDVPDQPVDFTNI